MKRTYKVETMELTNGNKAIIVKSEKDKFDYHLVGRVEEGSNTLFDSWDSNLRHYSKYSSKAVEQIRKEAMRLS